MSGKTFTVQPSAFVDGLTPDGQEMTRLPDPFHVDEAGFVGRQDFWKGRVYEVIGFARFLNVHEINLKWEEAVRDPARAVGMYVVTSDQDGEWVTQPTAVSEMRVTSQ